MDYSKLSDFEINKRVAICIHPEIRDWNCYDVSGRACFVINENTRKRVQFGFSFTTNPADAWPIIVANGISLNHYTGTWEASYEYDAPIGAFGTDETVTSAIEHKNPLRAAMIAFLLMQESQHA
ncbi:DUF2591 family protein [Cronobacter dublinensis]|nr:DUF2591 family protein [Cronobacter dublinensis]